MDGKYCDSFFSEHNTNNISQYDYVRYLYETLHFFALCTIFNSAASYILLCTIYFPLPFIMLQIIKCYFIKIYQIHKNVSEYPIYIMDSIKPIRNFMFLHASQHGFCMIKANESSFTGALSVSTVDPMLQKVLLITLLKCLFTSTLSIPSHRILNSSGAIFDTPWRQPELCSNS